MGRPILRDISYFGYPMVACTTTIQNSTVFDMTGYESLTAFVAGHTTDAGTSAGLSFSVGTASDSLSQTTGIQNPNLKVVGAELFRPTKRFARANFLTTVTTTGANAPVMIVIRHGAKNRPVTNDASATGKILYSPGTGTATG